MMLFFKVFFDVYLLLFKKLFKKHEKFFYQHFVIKINPHFILIKKIKYCEYHLFLSF